MGSYSKKDENARTFNSQMIWKARTPAVVGSSIIDGRRYRARCLFVVRVALIGG